MESEDSSMSSQQHNETSNTGTSAAAAAATTTNTNTNIITRGGETGTRSNSTGTNNNNSSNSVNDQPQRPFRAEPPRAARASPQQQHHHQPSRSLFPHASPVSDRHQSMLRQQAAGGSTGGASSSATTNFNPGSGGTAGGAANSLNYGPALRGGGGSLRSFVENNHNNNVAGVVGVSSAAAAWAQHDANAAAGGVPERDAEDYFNDHYNGNNDNSNHDSGLDGGPSPSSGWSDVDCSQDPSIGGVPPSARSLHAAALLNGILYVFGGYDGRQRVNTFHAFLFAEKRWSPVLPSANSGPPPSPRDRHVAVTFGNSFYVHGGFDGTARVSEFYAFDFSTMTWREVVALQGRPPSPRHSHAAVVHGHSLYIFGGYDGAYKSDLHEFDFTSSRWQCVPAAGRRPRARYRATCVVHKNYLILFGGHDGSRHMSDTHLFDFDNRTWMMVDTEGPPPIPRDSHVSVLHGNSMYVFGGSSGSAMNDLHELQLPSNPSLPARWRPVQTLRVDQPRHRFCHVAVVYNDSMYVFGGYDGSDRLNDFIRFDFTVYDLSFEVPVSTIISDFRNLINDSTLSDVTFIVQNQPVYAHKLMLMRCSYFQALFLGQMKESHQDTIRLDHVRHPVFLSILEYLYTDQLRIPLDIAMELFEAADLFCIPRLQTMCEKRMLQSINVENAAVIFHAADRHSAVALRQKCKKYILSHFEEVSKSSNFEEIGRSNIELVFELLQSR